MLEKIYKVLLFITGGLLLLMTFLTAAIGAEEQTLRVIGWITAVSIVSSLALALYIRIKK